MYDIICQQGVCMNIAEVTYPDGKGDQIHYCGEHEPN